MPPAPRACWGWEQTDLEGRLDGAVQGAQRLLVSVGCHCHHQIQEGEPGAERDEQVGNCRVTSAPRPNWDSGFESHFMHKSGTPYRDSLGAPSAAQREGAGSFPP